MIVMKFGGTSMGSAKRMREVADIAINSKLKRIVVVSAMTGTTDKLLKASYSAIQNKGFNITKNLIRKIADRHNETARELISDKKILSEVNEYIACELKHLENFLEALHFIRELTTTSYDKIVAVGEKLSACLLSAHLRDRGEESDYVNLEDVYVNNDKEKINNNFYIKLGKKIQNFVSPHVGRNKIPVCTGFFGKIPKGIISAVGRGYSDFCAAILGSAFLAKEIQIWTDVDGIMSADPRIVKKAFILNEVSFDEAAEMSSFGAKILHPQTIWPAVKQNIPVKIKNTLNPGASGTLITKEGKKSKKLCKAITAKKGACVISIISSEMSSRYGFLAKVFDIFRENEIAIDIVSTSEISISFTTQADAKTLKPVIPRLRKMGKVDILHNQAIVCAIGEEMGGEIGSGSKILASIATQGINASVITRSALKINISCVVDGEKADGVIRILHKDILEK